ncbi:MAG: tetratricopeptide repeat protein [Terracidiphilus sp.]
MTKICMRGLILLGGMVLMLPQGSFAQAPPAAAPSPEISAIQAKIAENPDSPWLYISLALAEIDANHPDEAIAAASHALAMDYSAWKVADIDFRSTGYDALAIAYAQKGDLANALSQVDAGLSRYPGSPYLNDTKGIVLLAGGQYSRASEVLLPAFVFATHTSDPKAMRGWGYVPKDIDFALGHNAALSQYFAGQYPQALETARQLVALHDLGSVCVNSSSFGTYVDAELPGTKKQCTDLVNGTIDSIDGHDVPSMYLQGGDYEIKHLLRGPVGSVAEISVAAFSCPHLMCRTRTQKLQIARQAVPLTKRDATDFAVLALTLNANGDREQALTVAQKAVALDPNSFWAELSYAVVLEDSNRPDEALKALETPTTPSSILTWMYYSTPLAEAHHQSLRQIHRAVLYARMGDMAKAQEIYSSAASHIDPRCLPAVKEKEAFLALVQPIVNTHLVLAKQLEAQGKYAESLPEYAQLLRYAANEQEASTLRAAMFAASGKMPTPPELPDEARRHVVRGELLLKDGMLDRALAEFNEALRIAPYVPKLYYNTALIYGQLKQYDQAIRQMRLYLLAAPEAPDARAAQDQITKWELQQEMEGKR